MVKSSDKIKTEEISNDDRRSAICKYVRNPYSSRVYVHFLSKL